MRNAARAGRETVCKGAGHHDDLANSAAGSLCLAALAPAPMTFAPPILVYSAPLGSEIIPSVIRDWPGNPLAPNSEEYRAGGGDLAQFAWSPNRSAPPRRFDEGARVSFAHLANGHW
jgi:hypothetical protein